MNYEYQPTCQIPAAALDAIYTEAFGPNLNDGTFVEIGAHDGLFCSNTWGLMKRGWQSHYAEPEMRLCTQLRDNLRGSNVHISYCAVGSANATVTLGMGDWGATGDPAWMTKPEKFEVQQWTLDALLERHALTSGFELLVIDVEGMEADVLAGFDCARWLPRVVIIERPPFLNCFRRLNYRTTYADNINTIYLRDNHERTRTH